LHAAALPSLVNSISIVGNRSLLDATWGKQTRVARIGGGDREVMSSARSREWSVSSSFNDRVNGAGARSVRAPTSQSGLARLDGPGPSGPNPIEN
jgi:hypothetical protein